MKIKLTKEQHQEFIEDHDFELDNEKYEYLPHSREDDMDDNGKSYTYYYQRQSDQKYFMGTITYSRYGYKDYGYDDQDWNYELIEVKQIPVIKYVWEIVKDGE